MNTPVKRLKGSVSHGNPCISIISPAIFKYRVQFMYRQSLIVFRSYSSGMFTFFSIHYFLSLLARQGASPVERTTVSASTTWIPFERRFEGSSATEASVSWRSDAFPLQSSGSCRGRAKPSLPSKQGRCGFVCVFMLVFLQHRRNLLNTLNGGRLHQS